LSALTMLTKVCAGIRSAVSPMSITQASFVTEGLRRRT
jgi:hypothetical protein